MSLFMEKRFAWEVVTYIFLLILIYTLVRFLATSMINLLKGFPDEQESVNVFINNVHYPVSYWTEKGGRPYQEDRHDEIKGVGKDDSSIYSVFDGHGGSKASQYCKENLLKQLISDSNFTDDPSKALERAFFRTDAEFSAMAKVRNMTDGTTAIVAVIHGKRIYVANAGDSRCVLVQKGGKTRPMSIDHKPNREDEEKRIKKLGGRVVHWGRWRVQGQLAVSRAIGDVALKPYVTCEPEILEKELSPEDEYLVLASDGVWDVISNEEVGKLTINAASKDFLGCAKYLCGEALIMGSTDNVTCLVIDLKRRVSSPSESADAAGKSGKSSTPSTVNQAETKFSSIGGLSRR